jgi:hypothetical protein
VRLLRPHLTADNHAAVLARARNAARGDIEALVAELAPKPDLVASVRKLPAPRTAPAAPALELSEPPISRPADSPSTNDGPDHACVLEAHAAPPPPLPSTHRTIVRASAPQRYRVQFTIDQASHDKLRRVQALLRREIPNGDTGVIFVRALDLFVETVEKAKLGAPARPQRTEDGRRPGSIYETRIRFETDERAVDSKSGSDQGGCQAPGEQGKITPRREWSRHIPKAVRRVVWRRDGGRCAFVSSAGRRCTERTFLEFHHVQPYAMDGPATVGNISLRCRRHNQYEAEVVFGPPGPTVVREAAEEYRSGLRTG